MNELFNVKDKVVVITGGAGILGKGIAAYLAKEGAKVVVLDRSEEAGKALVDSIKAEGNGTKDRTCAGRRRNARDLYSRRAGSLYGSGSNL